MIINSGSLNDNETIIIRSEAILDGPPSEVYELFSDNNRVQEYNENCRELEDIIHLSETTKINWSATGKFGPFAARDFVTLVTFQSLGQNKGYVSLGVKAPSTLVPVKKGYVRSQIELAATFMYPVPGQPHLTRFVQVTQVGELGGAADSVLAKKIMRNLEEKAPIEIIKKFNNAVKKSGRNKTVM